MSLADVMTRSIIALELDDDLSKAKQLFEQHNIHHIFINSEDGTLAGIINDRDLYKHLSPTVGTKNESPRDTSLLSKKIHQIMSRDLITAPPNISLNEAVLLFHRHHISCLPVMDDDFKAIGVITWRDIIKLVANQYKVKKHKNQLRKKTKKNIKTE